MGTEEAVAVDFTKCPDHFNLEVAEGFPPRQYAKAPQEHIFFNNNIIVCIAYCHLLHSIFLG